MLCSKLGKLEAFSKISNQCWNTIVVRKQAMEVRKEYGGEIQREEQERDKDEDKYIQTLEMNLMSEGLPDSSQHILMCCVSWQSLCCWSKFNSAAQSCPTLWDPINRSTPGLPVHHQLPKFTQTHAHQVGDATQPSHLLSSPSPPAPNPSQHQGLFQGVNSLHEVAKILEFQLQHQSFQWTPRTDLL